MAEIKTFKGFACSCGGKYKEECANVMNWALEYLNKNPEFSETVKEYFLERAVLELGYSWGATIDGIIGDQWFLVQASADNNNNYKQKKGFKTSIECDRILDGIAYTLKAFHDHYGGRRVWIEDDTDTD